MRRRFLNTNNTDAFDYSLNYLSFTSELNNSTISLISNTSPNIKYSLNGGNWVQWDYKSITLNAGDVVYMKGNNSGGFSTSSSNYNRFNMTGKISASGNIMSLLYEEDFEVQLSIPCIYCYYSMFKDCTSLTTAPELPATTLADDCYFWMFRDCTSLTTAPELPATTLADRCYRGMFEGCTSLTTAPELPATTLASDCYLSMFSGCTSLIEAPTLPATTLASYCYRSMFSGCTGLTTAPALPATTLVRDCYSSMFIRCTSLTTAPELPATTLAYGCYEYMFVDCTSLTSAPILPATTLATFCYSLMFQGCTSLTSAPQLPATTLKNYCYQQMFKDCTSLTTAPELSATTLTDNCYMSMFSGCTSLTTAPELPATELSNECYRNMFDDCTSLTTAPELPATELSNECYRNMFGGCTSLTTAPELPATTLADYCYWGMFNACSKLNNITMLAIDITADECLSNWVKGVASTGLFVKNKNAEWDVIGDNGVPEGWEVITDDMADKTLNNITLSYTKPTGTGLGLYYAYIESDYPVESDVLIQMSTDDGDTWNDYAIIDKGSTTPLVTKYHSINQIYRLNPSPTEDDTYIYNLVIVELIKFYIDNTEYQAEEGMTWEDWCNSEYNTDDYYCDSNYVRRPIGANPIIFDENNGDDCIPTDVIIHNRTYGIWAGGSND